MRGSMLLELSNRIPYGPFYRSSDTGKALIERYPQTAEAHHRQIDFVTSRRSILGAADLERLATALYVMKEEGDAPVAIQAQRINKIKPHIPISKAEEAIHEVKNLAQEYSAMLA